MKLSRKILQNKSPGGVGAKAVEIAISIPAESDFYVW